MQRLNAQIHMQKSQEKPATINVEKEKNGKKPERFFFLQVAGKRRLCSA